MKIKINYINTIYTIFCAISFMVFFLYILIFKTSIPNIIKMVFIPFFIMSLLVFITNKYNKKWFEIISNILSSIIIVILPLYYIICGFILIVTPLSQSDYYINNEIRIEEYSDKLATLTDKKYRINHFPKEIPPEAQNIKCIIEESFDGFNINYLTFNVPNNKYLNKIIYSNKSNINLSVNLEDSETKYHYLFSYFKEISYDKTRNYKLYILNNQNNDFAYTSGFIISKEDNHIIFFYANYNLEKSRDVYGNILE